MSILNDTQRGIGKLAKSYFEDNSKFLFHSAAIGWTLASAAQTIGLVTNDKLSKEEKKFLVPQEMADGILNIGMYCLVTSNLIKNTDKKFKVGFDQLNNQTITPKIKITQIENALKNGKINISEYKEAYKNAGKGAKVVASLIGAVISSNILTPIIRNIFGAYTKKRFSNKNADTIPQNVYDGRTQPFFRKTYDPTQKMNLNAYMNFAKNPYSGNMKI